MPRDGAIIFRGIVGKLTELRTSADAPASIVLTG
jgi:hypothetical protein